MKVTKKSKEEQATRVHKVKTRVGDSINGQMAAWWNAASGNDMRDQLLSSVAFLKQRDAQRIRNAAIFARLYGNLPLSGIGGISTRMSQNNTLPVDRPTMSVLTSGVDTIVSRLSQNKPRPIFLTDNADFNQRSLAKQMNQFILGELFSTRYYDLAPMVLRDACAIGTGMLKIYETTDNKVGLERRLCTEVLVDHNDAYYGSPKMLYEPRLVDRQTLHECFPNKAAAIEQAINSFPDASAEGTATIADQVMVVEAWRLPSSSTSNDGMHTMVCSHGVLLEEKWNKMSFPFVKFNYADRLVGYWGQGLCERGMGSQFAINQLLQTIHRSINLVGVPRVFVEDGSKVVKAHLNNEIGSIVTYSGTKPSYEVAPCVPVELYQQLDRVINYFYAQEGISQLAAQAKKSPGLTSGIAIREEDDLQSDRFTTLEHRYDQMAIDVSYQIIAKAKEIAERDGKYASVYPNKDGTKQIDLPKAKMLEDTYVIQCFDMSSLPRDPAGRSQKIIELMQAGIYTSEEGRRLLGFSDTEQVDKLKNAGEERILKILDEIVEKGEYTPPDPFMQLDLCITLALQYYNLYMAANLTEERAQMLRDFHSQALTLQTQSMQPGPTDLAQQAMGPIGVPNQQPVSDLMPVA
jgi:hypothetical protein